MDDSDVADQELSAAIALLRDGRVGASPEWVRAAEHYVAHCRERVERLARRRRKDLGMESRIDPGQPFFPRIGQRPN